MTASQRLEESQSVKKPLEALKYFTTAATSSLPLVFNEKHHRLLRNHCTLKQSALKITSDIDVRQKSKSLIDKPHAKNMPKKHRSDNQAFRY